MKDWKESELKDISEIQTGPFGSQLKNEQYITGGTPVVTVEHIQDFRIIDFDYPSVTNVDRDRLSRYLLEEGDIVFSRVGSVDLSAPVKPHQRGWIFSSRMLRVRPNKKEINSIYLGYYFQQPRFRENIVNISVGATMPSINTNILKGIRISYPELHDQEPIASFLASLDAKIDLLHSQNGTLEKMAETIFRKWFVEEARPEWPNIELGEIVELTNGVSYSSEELKPSKTAMVTLKSFNRRGGFNRDGYKEFTGKYKEQHILRNGDLLVAHTDITQDAEVIGNPILVSSEPKYEAIVFSMDLVKVTPKDMTYSNNFIYFLMRTRDFKEHCLGYSNGSTVLHLSKKAIPMFELKIPPKTVVQKFLNIVDPMIEKYFLNQSQVISLKILRDMLLTKLMNGEVKVN